MFDVSSSQRWLWNAVCPSRFLGRCKECDDLDVVAASMPKPGVILRRPAGSDGPFREQADLHYPATNWRRSKSKHRPGRTTDDKTERKAALAFEKEQRKREIERRKEVATRERDRERLANRQGKARLPLGAETTPMTCVSPISRRQFVVISAGGNLVAKDRGTMSSHSRCRSIPIPDP
jgi:hypothetical protein